MELFKVMQEDVHAVEPVESPEDSHNLKRTYATMIDVLHDQYSQGFTYVRSEAVCVYVCGEGEGGGGGGGGVHGVRVWQ